MNEFEKFLEENHYEGDLEFQLCDLEMAFDAGKELQWKPSEEQISVLSRSLKYINTISSNYCHVLGELLNQLKKLREE